MGTRVAARQDTSHSASSATNEGSEFTWDLRNTKGPRDRKDWAVTPSLVDPKAGIYSQTAEL